MLMPLNDFSLCSKPGGDVICDYCIRNTNNTHPKDESSWIKPDWNTSNGYCKHWLKYEDLKKWESSNGPG